MKINRRESINENPVKNRAGVNPSPFRNAIPQETMRVFHCETVTLHPDTLSLHIKGMRNKVLL